MGNLLRYRAWDKLSNYIFDVALIDFDTQMVKLGGRKYRNLDEVILMQSTGLKDKNGKEIFEGDIIATNSFACIVSFGKYDYFEDDGIKITGIGFYLGYLNVEPATYSPFESPFLENCEVLGNIHENMLDLIMYEKWKSENWELMEGNV
ncbi:YopX family protein [Streptococcus anginosus]|uniref:YopX family protein n=1 Tax=Streptococcus anginosus TaxID=1328 RepID=UPI00070EA744|nr:YopX family protein [Streptococcus anginosus]